MARKTQQEVNFWFQDNTVKSALDLSLIEKVLHNNNLDIPNNIIIHKNGNTYDDFAYWYCDEIKISKYPKNYEECCQHLGCDDKIKMELIGQFIRLINARNAYWKIAGEEMGLGKPWEPDWTNLDQLKYCIWVDVGEFITMINVRGQHILAFPTEEMRDAFYENFKELIEQCKTLL